MDKYLVLQRILEMNSFTRAALELGYSQSAVSQMMSSLEDELGIKILNRSRTGVTLTQEGAQLYPLIEQLIMDYRVMKEKTHEINGLQSGTIRIGTISSVTCHWLPQLIKSFQKKYPKIQFVLHQGDYTSIQEWIKTGKVDFGFINPKAVKGLTTQSIKEGKMLAILPEKHELAENCYIEINEFDDEAFILLEEGHYSEPLDAFNKCRVKPDIRYVLHDDYAIMTMVEAGLGVSILPELVLKRTNYRLAVRAINPPIRRELAVGYRDEKNLTRASKYFIDYIIENKDKLD